jgi:Uma2 family endonuclease
MLVEERAATLDDLARIEGKAELIAGRIMSLPRAGRRPNRLAGRIVRSLDDYAQRTGRGEVYTDNIGFAVPELRSGRCSFSPDASYYSGPFSEDPMRFIEGPPTFAAEVRSEHDFGAPAEQAIADKRRDYFEAGTQVVWDVDTRAELIRSFTRDSPDRPAVFARGQVASAEPAVPGWTLSVDELFRP